MSRHRKGGAAPFWFRVFCYVIAVMATAWLFYAVVLFIADTLRR